ncbi:hypothetical protein PTIM40_197 [Cyanophage P-TIM40]|uniref:Uncharacterized protein n=1 Tax=Cyanophage P-TIM40 TaxID=1589733 RepID=A0A0C5AE38_9CAUD|nr:hypothetical protein AU107_gp196 [Cyanophage P-TIM40]AJK27612.1 hypothetical protein PTIM40_197 [Cyanophage P-TIM40]
MIHLVGILVASVTCLDISEKIDRVKAHPDLTPLQRAEIIEIYEVHLTETLGLTCSWDAND